MSRLSARNYTRLRIKEFPCSVNVKILQAFKLPEHVKLVLWLSNWRLIAISEFVNDDTITSYLHMLNTDNQDGYKYLLDQMKAKICKMRLMGYYDSSLQKIAKTLELRLKEAEISVEIIGDVIKAKERFDVMIVICQTTREVNDYVNMNDYNSLVSIVDRMMNMKPKESIKDIRPTRSIRSEAPRSMRRPSEEPPVRPVPKSARRPSDVELTRR